MTINHLPHNCTPDMGRIMLEGVQEIIGRAGIYATFNTAHLAHLLPSDGAARLESGFSHDDMGSLMQAMVTLYGPRGGHGIAQRSGRASFKYLLRSFGDEMGLTELEYRLLPSIARIKTGLEALSATMTDLCGGTVELAEEAQAWFWKYRDCPWCRPGAVSGCHYTIGLLQEFLGWASGGRMYHVVETGCIATGGETCSIRIDKQPFD